MKALWLLLAVAACTDGGVSSDPHNMDWDTTLDAFAQAHCDWNFTCDARHDATCTDEVKGIMNDQTRPELAAGQEDACVACMQAWTAAYQADTSPCSSALTFDQSHAITMACMAANCVENHDLPGTGPQ
jgi:hypothetical protein